MNNPHCGPCSGDCRQGRDCPRIGLGAQPEAVESMLAHRRMAALVRWVFALLLLLATAGYITHP